MPRGTPGKNAKSILYRMHNKPKKQLNILDGSSQRYLKNSDVQRFNEDFDNQSMKSYATLSSSTKFNKPPLQAGARPRTNPQGQSVLDSIRSRLTKTIENNEEDRGSVHRSQNGGEGSLLREKALNKLRKERKISRANLIQAIKGMNESQLNKISNMLKVRIDKNEQAAEDEGTVEQAFSEIGLTEADELNDKVEELQDALLQDQGLQDDVLSRTSSKLSVHSSLRSKVGRSPLSQAGSSLTRISQIQNLRQELEQEKNARLSLEKELNELKKISTEISRHLDTIKTVKPQGHAWPTPAAGVPNRH